MLYKKTTDDLRASITTKLINRFIKAIKYQLNKYIIKETFLKETFLKLYNEDIRNAFFRFIESYSTQYFYIFDFINIRKYYQNLLPIDSIFYYKSTMYSDAHFNKSINMFNKLKSVIKDRFFIDYNIIDEVFIMLLNQSVLDYYSIKWQKEHSITINNSIEEFIYSCVYNNLILKNDKSTLSLLYYYVASKISTTYDQLLPNQKMIDDINILIKKYSTKKNNEEFESFIFSPINNSQNIVTIDDVDLMSGFEFEEFIKLLFIKMGFNAYNTQKTGDQGIDVIAEKNLIRYGIQCKCYSSTVGNSAIQEVYAGKQYYNLDKVIVVTNNEFTKSAISLASANNVILWNRFILNDKIIKFFNK